MLGDLISCNPLWGEESQLVHTSLTTRVVDKAFQDVRGTIVRYVINWLCPFVIMTGTPSWSCKSYLKNGEITGLGSHFTLTPCDIVTLGLTVPIRHLLVLVPEDCYIPKGGTSSLLVS